MTTNGVCINGLYVMIIFSFLTHRCILMGCLTVQKAINTVTEGSCLFTRIEIRIDVKGGGERVSSERQFDIKH